MPRICLHRDWVEYEKVFVLQEDDTGYTAEESIEVTDEFLSDYLAAVKIVNNARSTLEKMLATQEAKLAAAREEIQEAEYQRNRVVWDQERQSANQKKEELRKAKGLLFKSFRANGETAIAAYLAEEAAKGELELSVAKAKVEEFRVKDASFQIFSNTPEAIAKREAKRLKREREHAAS